LGVFSGSFHLWQIYKFIGSHSAHDCQNLLNNNVGAKGAMEFSRAKHNMCRNRVCPKAFLGMLERDKCSFFPLYTRYGLK
jgi:hypothetical protein